MRKISETGKEMLSFQATLAETYHYAPIEPNLFIGDVREKYLHALPDWVLLSGAPAANLYSSCGTHIATGYVRVVTGDYGCFLECSPAQIVERNICCKPGQEYRINDPRFASNVKYHWLTAKDDSDIKIYFQQKAVSYADYIPGMFYISPYELFITPE